MNDFPRSSQAANHKFKGLNSYGALYIQKKGKDHYPYPVRRRFKLMIVIFLSAIATSLICANSQASQDLNGKKCFNLGQERMAGKSIFKCVTKKKKLIWLSSASSKSTQDQKIVFYPWSTEINQKVLLAESKRQFNKWLETRGGELNSPILEVDPRLKNEDFSWMFKSINLAVQAFGSDSPSTFTVIIAKDCEWVRSMSSAPCKDSNGNQYFSDSVSQGFFVFQAVVEFYQLRTSDLQTAAHEYFHTVQAKLSTGANWPSRAPVWFIEGGAYYIGLSFSDLSGVSSYLKGRNEELLERGYETRKYLPLEKYTYSNFVPPSNYEDPYGIGCVATEFIVASVGIEKYLDIYRNLGVGLDFKTAFEAATGLSLLDFYAKFEQIRGKVGMPHGK